MLCLVLGWSEPLVSNYKVRLVGIDRILKLMLDYFLTIPGLIAIAAILAVIVLATKPDSPGLVIHRRRVMGLRGREFHAYNFRTIYPDGNEILAKYPELQEELACKHKLREDPRITWVGQLLRKASLDELPQLFNVLRHEMSLV